MTKKSNGTDAKLAPLRQKIDKIDDEILGLLDKRMQIVREIGAVKLKERSIYLSPKKRARNSRATNKSKSAIHYT